MMNRPPPHRPPLTVWIDGDCSVCLRSKRWCTDRDHQGRLVFRNIHALDNEPLPESLETMMQTVHVQRPDGTLSTGFDAWRQILLELDRWRWLARLAGLPGVRHLGPVVYGLVAGNRHLL